MGSEIGLALENRIGKGVTPNIGAIPWSGEELSGTRLNP